MTKDKAEELFKYLNHRIPMESIIEIGEEDGEWELTIW